jgi:hypothetical protein
MDVADLYHAVAVKAGGEIGDLEGTVGDVELVPGDFTGVEGHACCGGCGSGPNEKSAAGDVIRWFRALGPGHFFMITGA